MHVKSLHCPPSTYTVLCVNYISIKPEGRKDTMNGWRTHFRGVPRDLPARVRTLGWLLSKWHYLLWSTLSWRGMCFKQKRLYWVAGILSLFLLKIHLLWKNPKRWSTSLTSGGRAALPHVHGAVLPALIISSNLRSGGVAWLFPATWAACWFPGALEREKHKFYFRTVPVFVYW